MQHLPGSPEPNCPSCHKATVAEKIAKSSQTKAILPRPQNLWVDFSAPAQ